MPRWMMFPGFRPVVCFAPEGTDGGTGADGGDADAASAAPAEGGQEDGGTGWTPPEGLPAHLVGKDAAETLSKVWTMADGYRRRDAEREQQFGKVPKSPKEYGFTPSDKVKPYLEGFENDGFLNSVFEKAHARGFTDKQANGFLNDVMEMLLESGHVEGAVDYSADLAALVPEDAKDLDEKGRKDAVTRRIQNNLAFFDGLKAQNANDPAFAEIMDALTDNLGDTRTGQLALEWIRSKVSGEGGGSPTTLGRPAGGYSEAGYEALLSDPRSDDAHPQHKAWQAEKTAYAKALWGTRPTV